MSGELVSRGSSVKDVLRMYLEYGGVRDDLPLIQLALLSQSPPGAQPVDARGVVVSTAYQCYAPGKTELRKRDDDRAKKVALSTRNAGHLTTRQHMNYTWLLDGVSRGVIHDVLHAFPYYNTEQQSQRFVEARRGSYVTPFELDSDQAACFMKAADYANGLYFDFLHLLEPLVEARVRYMYPEQAWRNPKAAERMTAKSRKLAQEIARYVLPVAQKSTLYYTLSELELLRLFRASQMSHVTDEARYIVASMIQEVVAIDPTILDELEVPGEEEQKNDVGFNERYVGEQQKEFDATLQERNTALVSDIASMRAGLMHALSAVCGVSAFDATLQDVYGRLFDPKINKYLNDIYDIGIHHPLTQVLRMISLVFITKLSHTADSQRQRHRRTPAAIPPLSDCYTGRADFITPHIVSQDEQLMEWYQKAMEDVYASVEHALELGLPRSAAMQLLPNAHALRLVETGDLFDWIHRFKQRLCFLAQEEIFFISVQQAQQVLKHLPEARLLFQAPCGIRSYTGTRPRCPEGDRWCGRPVFNWDIDHYMENRLI